MTREGIDKPWRDADTLRRLYYGRGMTLQEMGDELGCSDNCVMEWMGKFGIERRDAESELDRWKRKKPAHYRTTPNGYEAWHTNDCGEQRTVLVHRLLAVAVGGTPDRDEWDVHHKNGVKWDNRPENIEVVDPREHRRIHAKNKWQDEEYRKERVKEAENRSRDSHGRFESKC